jgi:hypothetical protein
MKDRYESLKKKHSLPSFEALDNDFEIFSIEEDQILLREVRERIVDKIELAIKMFEDILHPDSGFASYKEAAIFTDNDRDMANLIYKKLMYYHRYAKELSFGDSDELNAKYINEFMKEWPELKKGILKFIRMMKDSWLKDIPKKLNLGYMG